MKKIIVLMIAALLIFAACTPAEKEAAAENAMEQEDEAQENEEAQATGQPTEEATAEPEPMPNLVAVVIARDRYASAEFTPVMAALSDAGYDTVVVSDELGTANGTEETTEVGKVFADFTADDLCGIVLIGGSSSLWENTELHALLADCRDSSRVTAAICLASVTLAKAGIIGEGDAACWFNCDIADPEMEAAGVSDTGLPVTVDGLIITGDGPDSAEEFAQEVVAALDGL